MKYCRSFQKSDLQHFTFHYNIRSNYCVNDIQRFSCSPKANVSKPRWAHLSQPLAQTSQWWRERDKTAFSPPSSISHTVSEELGKSQLMTVRRIEIWPAEADNNRSQGEGASLKSLRWGLFWSRLMSNEHENSYCHHANEWLELVCLSLEECEGCRFGSRAGNSSLQLSSLFFHLLSVHFVVHSVFITFILTCFQVNSGVKIKIMAVWI